MTDQTATTQQFVEAGCGLATPVRIFLAIYQLSGGKPCKGCAYDSFSSKCAAKRELFPVIQTRIDASVYVETVRESAARLGISISEVRRRRRVQA